MTDKKIAILFMILTVLVFLGGCAFLDDQNRYTDDEESWQNEIMMASECGLEQMRCCTEENELCQIGLQCCFDPNGSNFNYCSPDCTCGQQNSFCCAGDEPCSEGLVCQNNFCEQCGNIEEPCCANDECNDDLDCYNGNCVECGKAGNPCCANDSCQGKDSFDNTRAECQNGICVLCGYGGKKKCTNEPFCNPEHLLNNKSCLACGDLNQPCCETDDNAGQVCQGELKCNLGFCTN